MKMSKSKEQEKVKAYFCTNCGAVIEDSYINCPKCKCLLAIKGATKSQIIPKNEYMSILEKEYPRTLEKRLADAIKVCLLDKDAIRKVSTDKHMSNISLLLVLLSAILSPLVDMFLYKNLNFFPLFIAILIVIAYLFYSFHLLSKLFGGKAKFIYFFRPMGCSFIQNILFIFVALALNHPLVSLIGLVWFTAIVFMVLKEVYKFSIWKTIILIVINSLIFLGIVTIFSVILSLFFPDVVEKLIIATATDIIY